MPFDPNQPFEVVGGGTAVAEKPAFDPTQSFEAVDKPPFDPNADFEPVSDQSEPDAANPKVDPATPRPTVGDYARMVPAAIAKAGGEAIAGMSRLASKAGPTADLARLVKKFKPDSETWLNLSQDIGRDIADRAMADYGIPEAAQKTLGGEIIQAAGSIVPIVASGPAAILTGAGQAGEGAREEAFQAGASEDQQARAFILNSITGAVTEKFLGVPALFKSAKAAAKPVLDSIAKQVATQAVKSFAREGAQETLQQFAKDAIAKWFAAYDPERNVFDVKKLGKTFLVGGFVGGALGATTQFAATVDARLKARQATMEDEIQEPIESVPSATGKLKGFDSSERILSEVEVSAPPTVTPIEARSEPILPQAPESAPTAESLPPSPPIPGVAPDTVTTQSAQDKEARIMAILSRHKQSTNPEEQRQLWAEAQRLDQELMQEEQEQEQAAPELLMEQVAESTPPAVLPIEQPAPPVVETISATESPVPAVEPEATGQPEPSIAVEERQPAVEAAPASEPPQIGVRNAITDQVAKAMGLPERVTPETYGSQAQLDDAQAAIQNDPAYGSSLITEVNEKPRALNTLETNVVLYELAARKTAYNNAVAAANSATTPEAKASAETRMRTALNDVQTAIEATRTFGTEQGRALEARKRLIAEQYELPIMLATAQATKGTELNADETAEITKLHQQIADSQKRIEELEAQVAASSETTVFDQLVAEAGKTAQQEAKAGKSFLDTLKASHDEALKNIRKRRGRLSAGVDPTELYDYARIGAYHIANGATKLAQFTAKMVEEVGDWVRDHIDEIFNASKGIHDASKGAFKAPRSRRKGQPVDVVALIAKDAETGVLTHRTAYEVVKQKIEQGVQGFEPVMQAATDELAQSIPGVTREQVGLAFSEYGKTQFPSKEELKQTLSEYRRLEQLQRAIEDTLRGEAPKKTGMQRNKPTQAVREKMAELRKAMDEAGIETQSAEDQLASRNQARATALRNQIEDLDKRLQGGPKREKGRPAPDSPEVERLRAERDAMREELQQIEAEADPEAADAEAIKRTEAQIAELDRRLQEGDLSTKTREGRPASDTLERLRAERKAMQQQLDRMRREAQPKQSEDERYLARAKKAIARRTAEVQRRLREGDFSKPVKKERPTDKELDQLRFENAKAKQEYARANFERELANQSLPRKALRTGAEIANTARAVMTSADLSAMLRQGGFIALGHPVRAAKGVPAMLKAFASEKAAFKVDEEILARPNAPLYRQAGLYLAEQNNHLPSKMEEAYMSRWAQKIPGVSGSARAYSTFLNKLRADSFDAMVASLSATGKPTIEEAKAVANFINVATGRAPLGRMEPAGQSLATIFFSPRYVASRFQLLAGQPFYGGNKRTRQLVAKEYGRFLIGLGVVYALLAAAQDDDDPMVELDPRSSDFGKVRFGETRVDPLAGLAQVTTFLARELTGETKNLKGKVTRLREDMRPLNLFRERDRTKKDPFGSDGGDVAARFLRTKLAPVPGAVANLISGRNVIGEETSLGTEAMNTIIPLSFREIGKTMEEQGIPRGSVLMLLSLLGMGVNTYAEKEKNKN